MKIPNVKDVGRRTLTYKLVYSLQSVLSFLEK